MRAALLIVGLVAAAIGLIWIGQGSGVFPYPGGSIMINKPEWIHGGASVFVAGFIAAIASRWIS
jgi:hypothetical protein